MKVLDVMMGTPYFCRPESNLGSATELMWTGNCGFLPVVGMEGKVVGVVTDRDICIALGTWGRPSGEVAVSDVMSKKVFSCAPEDDVRSALAAMREGRVRRLPVITKEGALVGVISIDDVLLRSEAAGATKTHAVSAEEIVNTLRAANAHQLPVVAAKHATA
jgi:CBS domain-containing protein